jgi:uncharacterized protein with HEPN domain/predicted nucleotidyltransferase
MLRGEGGSIVDREIARHSEELARMCRRYGVRQLDLFGSAARGNAEIGRSDLDFLVEFRPLSPGTRADAYFGLKEGLENLFGRPVDLVVQSAIRNPYFRRSVERTSAAGSRSMPLEHKKYLYDIQQAGARIARFTDGKAFADYETDEMLQAAVERQFEIIGEALERLVKLEPAFATQISEHTRIIAFRNTLIHGDADVDASLVWDIVAAKLPRLRREIADLLSRE